MTITPEEIEGRHMTNVVGRVFEYHVNRDPKQTSYEFYTDEDGQESPFPAEAGSPLVHLDWLEVAKESGCPARVDAYEWLCEIGLIKVTARDGNGGITSFECFELRHHYFVHVTLWPGP
jgi:hypothetical protein